MRVDQKQITKLILTSLKEDRDSWAISQSENSIYKTIHNISNEKLGCSVWVGNGLASITIYKIGDSPLSKEMIQPSFINCARIWAAYKSSIHKTPKVLMYVLYALSSLVIAPVMIQKEYYKNMKTFPDRNKQGEFVHKLDLDIDMSIQREERLKQLLD